MFMLTSYMHSYRFISFLHPWVHQYPQRPARPSNQYAIHNMDGYIYNRKWHKQNTITNITWIWTKTCKLLTLPSRSSAWTKGSYSRRGQCVCFLCVHKYQLSAKRWRFVDNQEVNKSVSFGLQALCVWLWVVWQLRWRSSPPGPTFSP